ncbi:hypothetical protein ACL2XP_01730 [Sodalis sp. RH21]|uniref:hypothetical protein n=1 Tax=unclassified Sodalis (in: enterobacteria) TaxID=2636512 RepID=UPI0039B47D8F
MLVAHHAIAGTLFCGSLHPLTQSAPGRHKNAALSPLATLAHAANIAVHPRKTAGAAIDCRPGRTLADMPPLVIGHIVRYLPYGMRRAFAEVLPLPQQHYITNEVKFGEIMAETIPAVMTGADFAAALKQIATLPAGLKNTALLLLSGKMFRLCAGLAPQDVTAANDARQALRLFSTTAQSLLSTVPAMAELLAALNSGQAVFARWLGTQAIAARHCGSLAARFGIGQDNPVLILLEKHFIDGLAGEEALAGGNCRDIAARYAISTREGIELLERFALKGPALHHAVSGVSCFIIAARYGINSAGALHELESTVLSRHGLLAVEAGDNCNQIALHYGISLLHLRQLMEQVSIEHVAARQVINGGNCQEVAHRYGIVTQANREILERHAVNGPAGEQARAGRRCDEIAMMYGIRFAPARRMLESLSVEYCGKRDIAAGINCAAVAARYGISSPPSIIQLEIFCVENVARKEVEQGAHCWRVAEKYGLATILKMPHPTLSMISTTLCLLESYSTNSVGRTEALRGEHPLLIAKKYGISEPANMEKLQRYFEEGMAMADAPLPGQGQPEY